jgi:hypothetical protein
MDAEIRRGLKWVEAREADDLGRTDYREGSGRAHGDELFAKVKSPLPYSMASQVPMLEPRLWGDAKRLQEVLELRQKPFEPLPSLESIQQEERRLEGEIDERESRRKELSERGELEMLREALRIKVERRGCANLALLENRFLYGRPDLRTSEYRAQNKTALFLADSLKNADRKFVKYAKRFSNHTFDPAPIEVTLAGAAPVPFHHKLRLTMS